MKKSVPPQSATSLPRAPRDDVGSRFAKYMIMMGIRIGCFIAMVLVTPYGWYTWVFGLGAVFLPYVAVIVANVGEDTRGPGAVRPERMIERSAPAASPAEPVTESAADPLVIRVDETPPREPDA